MPDDVAADAFIYLVRAHNPTLLFVSPSIVCNSTLRSDSTHPGFLQPQNTPDFFDNPLLHPTSLQARACVCSASGQRG